MRCHSVLLAALPSASAFAGLHLGDGRRNIQNFNWLRDFFEPPTSSSSTRQEDYPEQYPATYDLSDAKLAEDDQIPLAKLIRPLLKNTQLESRPLRVAFDADRDGWNPNAFHRAVDGCGAAVVIATTANDGSTVGGYNPKGWASLGGARPSVATFLFDENLRKYRKVGGGGLACARDDPGFGISFGPDGLVIALQPGREKLAQSKLGTYFERGLEDRASLFNGATQLRSLHVLVGVFAPGEDIPYSGGVLDMTSG